MKSKSIAKKARPSAPTTTDLGVLAAQVQAAVKQAQADKLKSKQAKKNFKVAKTKLKQARQQAKASARLAKKSKKALEKVVDRQRKAAKKAVKAARKKGKETKPVPAAKPVAKPGASRSGRTAVRKRPTAPVGAASQSAPVTPPAAAVPMVATDSGSSTGASSSPGAVL